MKYQPQTTIIDGKLYTRVAAAFISDKSQMKAFEQKSLCKIGSLEDAKQVASVIEETGVEARLVFLAWYTHPNLREPVLSEAVLPSSATVILVRVF